MLMLIRGAENSSEQGAGAGGNNSSDKNVAEGSAGEKMHQ